MMYGKLNSVAAVAELTKRDRPKMNNPLKRIGEADAATMQMSER